MAENFKTAVLFPGQGSQFVGMGKSLYESYQAARELFDRASSALGFDLAGFCFNGPEEQLGQTRVTQPAIFVHSLAAFRLLEERGLRPELAAGHSLGEYSALVAAGFLKFEEGLSLVGLRGELMQQAGEKTPGSMAAIVGLEDERIEELCRASADMVVPANFNAPGQVVVSGSRAGVERVAEAAGQAGARLVKILKVSGAFHSPLMSYAADRMRERLAGTEIQPGRIPLVANVTAEIETDPERIRALLVDQITKPVRWTASIAKMAAAGVNRLFEVGPGNVLSGLCRRIDRSLAVASIGEAGQIEAFRP